MPVSSARSLLAAGSILAASALVWAAPGAAAAPPPASSAVTAARATTVTLPWGRGPGQVGLRPARPDQPADGASAVAVGPNGDVWLLDRLNGRVLRLDAAGSSAQVAQVPTDAEDLAIGPDESLAVQSLVRSRVFVVAHGAAAGELPVPRTLRELVGFSLGPSHQVSVTNDHQETLRLGSPAVPQTVDAVLHSRREGAVVLTDGTGLTVRLDADRSPELLWNRFGDGRNHVIARRRLSGPVLSARLLGASGGAACLSLEHREHSPGFSVRREVLCVDLDTAAERLRVPLRGDALYLPRRYAAVGGDPPRLAVIEPVHDGLRVAVTSIPAGRMEVQR